MTSYLVEHFYTRAAKRPRAVRGSTGRGLANAAGLGRADNG